MKKNELRKRLLEYVSSATYSARDIIGIEKGIGLPHAERGLLKACIKELEAARVLTRQQKSRFAYQAERTNKQEEPITGRIRQLRQGKTLFIPSANCADALREKLHWGDETLELPVASHRSMGALDGDKVRIRLRFVKDASNRSRRGSSSSKRLELKVEEILERRRQHWVGTYLGGKGYGYVAGDAQSSPERIRLEAAAPAAAIVGMSVVVEALHYPIANAEASGKIVEVLGWPEDEGVDMCSLIRKHELCEDFPEAVLEESQSFTEDIPEEEYQKRDDWRLRCVVTIDPETARDYDDAISVRRLKRGWELAVHIADASYFVRTGSALDKEARKRGNSTYLPDRVLPMLPPVLCDKLCSLMEGVDRLTMLCLMQLNEHGQVVNFEIKPSVIRSYRRMTYGQVLKLIEDHESTGDIKLDAMLREAYSLAMLMRKERFDKGSLDLEMPSLQLVLDEQAKPTDIRIEEGDDAHRLIEEFMLAANECVACTLREKMLPALYRVHETPNPSRLQEFAHLVRQYGIRCGVLNSYEEINWVVDQIKQLPDAAMLKVSLLRSLMRARYSTQALGHFGLAKGDYCHFTSPIRRYADLVVHRSLHRLCGEQIALPDAATMAQIAEHISDTERNSGAAENEAKRMKLLQYLEAQCELPLQLRRGWTAFITGVIPRGMVLEVPQLQLKGFISVKDLSRHERWYFEGSRKGWSSATGKAFRMGDCIQVIIQRIQHEQQLVDFIPQLTVKS